MSTSVAPIVPLTPAARRYEETLAGRVSLLQLVDPAVTQQVRAGLARSKCPHCDESATLFVTPVHYECDACDAKGDVVSFQMAMAKVPYRIALEQLALKGGSASTSGEWQERLALATRACDTARKWYREQFAASPTVQRYWIERGYSVEIATREGIGYAPPESGPFLAAMRDARVPNTALFDAGLVRAGRGGSAVAFLRDRLIFPITDAEDIHAIGFGGRLIVPIPPEMKGKMRKYLNSPSSVLFAKKSTVHGLGAARAAMHAQRRVIVVEGYFARLRVLEAGETAVVASCGTSLTSDHATLIATAMRGGDEADRHRITAIVYFDENARPRAIAGARRLAAAGIDVEIVEPPVGSDDPDTLGHTRGIHEVKTCIDSAEAVWHAIEREHHVLPPTEIPLTLFWDVADAMLDYLASSQSRYERRAGIEYVAALFWLKRQDVINQAGVLAAPPKFPR